MQSRRLRSQGRAFAACAGFLLAAAGWLLPGEAAAPPLEQAALQMPPSVAQGQSVILRLAAGPSAAPRVRFQGKEFPLVGAGSVWMAVLAAPLELSPGRYPVAVSYLARGRRQGIARSLRVRYEEYPHQVITMRGPVASLYSRSVTGDEQVVVNRAIHGAEPRPLWSAPFVVPTSGRYSTAFGVHRVRNGRTAYRHKGVDIGGPEGRAIVAANDGIVRIAGTFKLFGNCVVLDHGAGVTTLYLHMSALEVEEGEPVRRGQLIGRMGATGAATGSHLHWSLYVHGTAVQPLQWPRDPSLARPEG
jgi:murein DD-endopeptidase MepM/ murein hydrolase activator NlpD